MCYPTTLPSAACAAALLLLALPSHLLAVPEIEILGGPELDQVISLGATNATGTNFGTVTVGEQQTLAFRIQNRGSSPLLIVSTLVSNPADFQLVGVASAVLPGNFDDFELTFQPSGTTAGPRTSLIGITNNDANEGAFFFTVRGEAAIPPFESAIVRFAANPGSLDDTFQLSLHLTLNYFHYFEWSLDGQTWNLVSEPFTPTTLVLPGDPNTVPLTIGLRQLFSPTSIDFDDVDRIFLRLNGVLREADIPEIPTPPED